MSEVKVNKLSPRSGTTVTLGDSGDTITIPSGVTLANSGTFTNFQSTGIDDNATETTITIDSNNNIGVGTSSPTNFGAGFKTLELKNASGDAIELVAGTGVIAQTIASNTNSLVYMGSRSNNSLVLTTNDTERMRIDSSGNVGIGNTTMSSFNSEANNLVVGTGAGDEGITIYTGSSVGNHGSIFFADGTDVNAQKRGQIRYEQNNEVMSFFTNTSERMRIDVSGRVYIGTTSQIIGTHNHTLGVSQSSDDTPITTKTNSTVDRFAIDFHNPNGRVGYVLTSGSSTTYATSSDYRLKENVSYDFDATTRLKQLRPARFNFIADADTTVDGFLAHEVSSIVPEAITGTHNEVEVWKEGEELPEGVSVGDNKLDGEGNTIPVYQGIDQAKLVPLLVKTIQELEARITALENA